MIKPLRWWQAKERAKELAVPESRQTSHPVFNMMTSNNSIAQIQSWDEIV